MTTETLHALFIKAIGPERHRHYEDLRNRNLLLDILHAGARKGSPMLRALIYAVHEHFQISPSVDVRDLKLLWMSEAIAKGAFFLRRPLQHLDSSLLESSIQKFHEDGGYNIFYAFFDREATSDIFAQLSDEDLSSIDRRVSLNSRGDKLLHILSSVTASEEFDTVVKLTDRAEVNLMNRQGQTALYRACMAGDTSNVLSLLSHGADPTIAPSPHGPTCLHWLFHFKPQDIDTIAKQLIEHGAQVHLISEQKIPMPHYPFTLPVGTPLHWAVEMAVGEASHSLLRQGANPSFRDGSDPYTYDENVRDLDMALPLDGVLCSAARSTALGFSAIDVAVKNGDHEMLEILLSDASKFDPTNTDEEGYTALHRLDAGEWLYTRHGSPVWRPLFQGPTVTRAGSLKETLEILLQHGFELDRLTNEKPAKKRGLFFSGQTALMIAVSKGSVGTIQTLLNAGADVNIANSDGDTALLSFTTGYAHDEAQQSKVVSLLLGANANIHARTIRGTTPFLGAASLELVEVVKVLLNHGADLRDRVTDKSDTRFGWLALTRLARDPHDDWLASQLNTHILPRMAQPETSYLRNDLLEKADLDGGTLLHYTAKEGLLRSCATLIDARVDINGLRRREKFRRGGTVVSYGTPLDEALKSGKYRQSSPHYSEQGM